MFESIGRFEAISALKHGTGWHGSRARPLYKRTRYRRTVAQVRAHARQPRTWDGSETTRRMSAPKDARTRAPSRSKAPIRPRARGKRGMGPAFRRA